MPETLTELSTTVNEQPAPTSAPAPPASQQPQMFFEPWLYLRNHPVAASLAFVLILLAGGAFLSLLLQPTYVAESIVYVSPKFQGVTPDDNHEHDREYDAFIEQQIYGVIRPENLAKVIDANRSFWVKGDETDQRAMARLQKELKVAQMGHSYQVSIQLPSDKQQGLSDFVNAITDTYLASARNDEFFGRDEKINTLIKNRQDLGNQIDADLRKQEQLTSSLGVTQLTAKTSTNPYDIQLEKIRTQLAEAHEKAAEADAQLRAMNTKGTSQAYAGVELHSDPGMMAIQTQLNNKRAQLILQMNGLTPENPLYIQSKAELDQVDKELDSFTGVATDKMVSNQAKLYAAQAERAKSLETQLTGDLLKTQSLAAGATPRLQQAEMLAGEIERLQGNYAILDNRIGNLALESESPSSVHVVSRAQTPTEPVGKHTLLFILALLFVASLGAVVTAFIADLADPNIYTAAEIKRLIGFAPIGQLLAESDFPEPIRAEYMLRLVAGIEQAHRRTGARTFVFTSAGKGDTRDLVQQLGEELSASGLATLVILLEDAPPPDPVAARPPTPPSIQLPPPPGAQGLQRMDYGSELTVEMDTPVQETYRVVKRSAQGIADFLRKSRTSYNTILIGADPLLLSASSEHLARIADGTVLVTESGQVTKKQLSRVAKLLERLKISGIAVVLSEITKQRADHETLENVAEYSQRLQSS